MAKRRNMRLRRRAKGLFPVENGGKTLRDPSGAISSPYPESLRVEAGISAGDAVGDLVLFDESAHRMHLAVVGVPASGRRNGLDSFSGTSYVLAALDGGLSGGADVSAIFKFRQTSASGTAQSMFGRDDGVSTCVVFQIRNNVVRVAFVVGGSFNNYIDFATTVLGAGDHYMAVCWTAATGKYTARLSNSAGTVIESRVNWSTANLDIHTGYIIGITANLNPANAFSGLLSMVSVIDGVALDADALDAIVLADANGIPPRTFGLPEWRGITGRIVDENDPGRLIHNTGSGADVTGEEV